MPRANVLDLEVVDTTYKFDGRQLQKVIDDIGTSQSELAREAGYEGASYICAMTKKKEVQMKGSLLKPILEAIKSLGGRVRGFKS